MPPRAAAILGHLEQVARLRESTARSLPLGTALSALKSFQSRRFACTYADLLAEGRSTAPAARFFLTDLYGEHDFAQRDAEFARIVPALVRLFTEDVIDTVAALAELHALSESLDVEMARALLGSGGDRGGAPATSACDADGYARAWRSVGRGRDREAQIMLTGRIGADLTRLTRRKLLRRSLHLMRAPARAAGLGTLQAFLENGFDTFAALGPEAPGFLATIDARERALARAIFAGDTAAPPWPWLVGAERGT